MPRLAFGSYFCSLILHRQNLSNLELPKLPPHPKVLGFDTRLPGYWPCPATGLALLALQESWVLTLKEPRGNTCDIPAEIWVLMLPIATNPMSRNRRNSRCTLCNLSRQQDNIAPCISAHSQSAGWGIELGGMEAEAVNHSRA